MKAIAPPDKALDPCAYLEAALGPVFDELRKPIHILVPDKESRVRSKGIVCHIWKGAVPPNSFIGAAEGVFAASPEFVFVLMGDSADYRKLVCLGDELCGSYSIRESDEFGFISRIPLSSTARLKAFIDSCEGVRGLRTARRALRFVLDNSASPMETIVVVLLCFPCSMGGYGFPVPVLNYHVEPSKLRSRMVEKRWYECDLCWPEYMVAVEYDSDQRHTGSTRIDRDSRRRNALISLGFDVMTLTRGQVFDMYAFDRFASQLAKRMGFRLRESVPDCTARRRDLRELLVDLMRNPW